MSSFDDKVFDYIKNGGSGGSSSDSSFPVGMCIKLAHGVSVPSTGTWELKGIYGRYNYEDDSKLEHWVEFLGASMIDNVRSKETIDSEVSWNYDDLLGEDNYAITTPFGTYLNESSEISSTSYTSEFNLNNGTTTYTGTSQSTKMTITNTDSKGIVCAVHVLISHTSKVPEISSDRVFYEYQRTA